MDIDSRIGQDIVPATLFIKPLIYNPLPRHIGSHAMKEDSCQQLPNPTDDLRSIIKSQYHASMAMLRDALERCPDDVWFDRKHMNAFWQIAYHTIFITHLYLQPNEAAFKPWKHHQADVQHPDGLAGPANPDATLPLFPEPYAKIQILEYWSLCDEMVDAAVDEFDLRSHESGFSWYKVSKLEHQFINIRHIQHHTAQLVDRLRTSADVGIGWVGDLHPTAG